MLSRTLIASASLLSILAGAPALAQDVSPYGDRDMENVDTENAYRVPLVYVMSVTNVTIDGGHIRGSAEVMNADAFGVSDIGYRIEVVGTEVDGYGESIYSYWRGGRVEVGALAPDERRALAFDVEAPTFPAGSYLVRMQIITSQGRQYGWGDAPVTITGDSGVLLEPTGLIMAQYGTEALDPLSGPNIDPETSFTITATVKGVSRDMIVVPKLNMFDFDTIRDADGDLTFDAIQLKRGQEKNLSYTIKSRKDPGVTLASLTLNDPRTGRQLSSLADFRWVIRGADAHILALRPINYTDKKGETLTVNVDLVGSPDAETVVDGKVTLTLLDDDGLAGSIEAPFADLKDSIFYTKMPIVLTRDLGANPRVESIVEGPDGSVYHNYSIKLEFSDEGKETLSSPLREFTMNNTELLGGILAAVAFAILVIGLTLWKRS